MKKIFTILAVLGALMFMVVPAQALLGMPDDQPGVDFDWWFLYGVPGLSTTNTLLTVWNVEDGNVTFDYTIKTKQSETVGDGQEKLTGYDMDSWTANYFIDLMADNEALKLLIDLDGDGTNDHYFGYINFANTGNINAILGHTMIADIAGGMFSLTNLVVREYSNGTGVYAGILDGAGRELFSANALANAKSAQVDGGPVTPTSFSLYPRYYVNSSSANSYLIIWTDDNYGLSLHVDWYDNDETAWSSGLPIPYELNIIDLDDGYIPKALWPAGGYEKEGWINLTVDDKNNSGFDANQEWLAWTWIKDTGLAAQSWSGLAPVARDVDREYPGYNGF